MKPEVLTVDDYQDMVRMFHDESDRGAAVLAGSYVENYLGTFLESKMVVKNKKLKDKIFGSNGALSTFSQRIDFARAFGILNSHACDHLDCVRDIRNHFAHHPKEASFSKSPVKDWVRRLAEALPPGPDGKPLFTEKDGRTVYLLVTGLLFITMNWPQGNQTD